jgi:hypothetical protein
VNEEDLIRIFLLTRFFSMSACGQWIQPPPLTGWSTAKQYIVLMRTDATQNETAKTASTSSKRASQQPAFMIRKRSKISEADAQSSAEEDSDNDQPTSNAASGILFELNFYLTNLI